jgi:hypothetical protein
MEVTLPSLVRALDLEVEKLTKAIDKVRDKDPLTDSEYYSLLASLGDISNNLENWRAITVGVYHDRHTHT